jgi:hypothetical protein
MNWNRARTRGFKALIIGLMVLMAVSSAVTPALAAPNSQADIDIQQPRHVSEPVEQTEDNGSRVYVARGQYLEIQPENFNQENVTSFSVQESEGTLSYDSSTGEYVLNTQGNAGTYHLHWTVSENGDTTVYTAIIRVQTASYRHLPDEQYEQLREDAERGASIISTLENAGDPDEPLEQKVEFSEQVLNFAHNPFSALTGQFMALQTLRFMTPAGWLDLGLIVLLVYGLTRGLYATIARLRKQLEKEEQVSRREDVQYLKMYKQVLAGQMMSDVDAIDDHQAAVLENALGTNLFTALRNFWNTWGAGSLKRMYADAMGTVGYSVRVKRDSAGEITSVDVLDPDSRDPMADGGEDPDGEDVDLDGPEPAVHKLANAPSDVVDALTWEQIDDRVFQKNPDISAVDHLMVANRDRPGDLISDLNISVPEDFQSRQEFMESIAAFIQHVQETEFTDDENYPREDRTVLNHLMAFTTVMEQEYNIPLDLWWRACIWNAEGLSRDDEAESVLADITDAGAVMDDVDTGSGTGGGPAPGGD